MREIYGFTALTLETVHPVPFGALIVNSRTGERLMRATNSVRRENDPSSHAEVRTVRLACKELRKTSLAGFTMYSTCEPCPMCMANALWAGLDRVVFGATIADASRHCRQIHIPATEVAERSDMQCAVDGPVLRDLCNTLFTHPNMQKAFRAWSPVKRSTAKKSKLQK
jgi:tRNA(Arg) A34 adenosine deaminase TadA